MFAEMLNVNIVFLTLSLQPFEFIRKKQGFLYFLFTHMVLFVSVTESEDVVIK